MARAKRHYIAGHIWHITHRCHKREFLLKFSKDRCRYLQWLWEAKKRYGLVILNYMVTSNHVHLLVADDGDRMSIPRSIQLVAGRTGQEYNQRKDQFIDAHRKWVASFLEDGDYVREGKWTQSIAIGGERFVKNTNQALGIRATGRKVVEAGEAYQLREPQVTYPANLGLKNDDIGAENTYFWDVN